MALAKPTIAKWLSNYAEWVLLFLTTFLFIAAANSAVREIPTHTRAATNRQLVLNDAMVQLYDQTPSSTRFQLGLQIVRIQTADGSFGQGTLFIFDGNLRILTNAHVIGSANQVSISGPAFKSPVNAVPKIILPEADLAVLELSSPNAQASRLFDIASATLRISKSTHAPLEVPNLSAPVEPNTGREVTLLYNDAGLMKKENRMLISYARKVKDMLIGVYQELWTVPANLNYGTSGGGFYRNGILLAVVTKVPENMQANAYAIPIEEIARKLAVSNEIDARLQEARAKSRGQRRGGGRDVGDGSDQADLDHWIITEPGCFNCPGEKIVNPFAGALSEQSIRIDGVGIVALQLRSQTSSSFFSTSTTPNYLLATTAQINTLRSENHAFNLLPGTPETFNLLHKERTEQPYFLEFLRVWNKPYNKILSNAYPGIGIFPGGTFNFWQVKPGRHPVLFFQRPQIHGTIHAEAWLHLVQQNENLQIVIDRNLNQVNLVDLNNQSLATLQRQTNTLNPTRILFEGSQGFRAIFIYSERNLLLLEKIVIELPNKVYEFSHSHPQIGFKTWK